MFETDENRLLATGLDSRRVLITMAEVAILGNA